MRNMDATMPMRKNGAHKINQPVSQMGQEMAGIPTNEQDNVLRGSPMTETALALLGAGSAYKAPGDDPA